MKLNISINDEYDDGDGLDHCTVTITPYLARRIKLFVNTIKKLKATYIEEFSDPDEYCKEDGSECEVRIDCAMLRVSDNDFGWKGYFKHSNTSWETERVDMAVVEEVLKVSRTPRHNLPGLLGVLKEDDAKSFLEERLKGG